MVSNSNASFYKDITVIVCQNLQFGKAPQIWKRFCIMIDFYVIAQRNGSSNYIDNVNALSYATV